MTANAVIRAWTNDESAVTHVGFEPPTRATGAFTMTSIEESSTDYKNIVKADNSKKCKKMSEMFRTLCLYFIHLSVGSRRVNKEEERV